MSKDIPSLIHAISGSSGGVLSMLLTYPLITVSTIAQTENEHKREKVRVSMLDTICKIYLKQGLRGFYVGLESALVGIGVTNFVYYYFYELTRKLLLRGGKKLSTVQSMIIGCIAGCITVIATNPIWVLNTRLTVLLKENKNRNTVELIIAILKESNGLKQLFRGVAPALVLVSNPIIQYSVFEQLKNKLLDQDGSIPASDAFVLGAVGKLLLTGLTYPYITLKLRMHLHGSQESKTMLELIKEITYNEGIGGFYNGLSVKLTQSILTALFLFYFKEKLVGINYKLYKSLSFS